MERIAPVTDDFEWLKILVYAKPKKGKTTFGASGPRPVLIVDCNERGTLSVRNFDDVDRYRVEVWTDIDPIFWHLANGDHKYQTVVIDTVTSLAQLCMRFVLGDEASRDPTKDPMMPGKREWGKVAELMKTVILNFRNLPMNVVYLAQEKRGYSEEEDDSPEVFPEISPSVRSALTPAVDIIGRLYAREGVVKKGDKRVKEMQRYLLIGDHETYITGDRSEAGLPQILRLPAERKAESLTRLIQQIKAGRKEQ